MLPPAINRVGELLRPLVPRVRKAMDRRCSDSGHKFIALQDMSSHMTVIEQALTLLPLRLDALTVQMSSTQGDEMVELDHAVSEFERVISNLLDGMLVAKASRASAEERRARKLLLRVYRHYLEAVCSGLDQLVEAIADPELAMQQQGRPSSGHVELTISFQLGCPPELTQLGALAEGLREQFEVALADFPALDETSAQPVGLVQGIGALTFGIGLAKMFFRRV